MDPPICRICGNKHWSRLCDGVTKNVTSAVTKPVTPEPSVTTTVTPLRQADLETDNRKLIAEVERLTAEIAMLKRELASARKPPMSDAERQRKRRAKHSPA